MVTSGWPSWSRATRPGSGVGRGLGQIEPERRSRAGRLECENPGQASEGAKVGAVRGGGGEQAEVFTRGLVSVEEASSENEDQGHRKESDQPGRHGITP